MKIREAKATDKHTLSRFLQGIIEAERPMDECLKDEHIEYYDPLSFINNDKSKVLIADIDGTPVGCGAAIIKPSKDYYKHDQHLYMAMMYVDPAHRGKGINGKIIQALMAWGQVLQIETCCLTVYPQNPGAIKAYEKLGFEPALLEMRYRSID